MVNLETDRGSTAGAEEREKPSEKTELKGNK